MTREAMARMAVLSSHNCFLATAVVPSELCIRDSAPGRCKYWHRSGGHPDKGFEWWKFARSIDDVPRLMREVQHVFGGRLAYAVVERHGKLNAYSFEMMEFYWHALWGVTKWALQVHRIKPQQDAVVIRARPDVYIPVAFELGPLRNYFRHGARGHPHTRPRGVRQSPSRLLDDHLAWLLLERHCLCHRVPAAARGELKGLPVALRTHRSGTWICKWLWVRVAGQIRAFAERRP